MSEVYEGTGTTAAFLTSVVGTFELVGISDPAGHSREIIDVSHLGNTAWKTKIVAKLKEGNPITLTMHMSTQFLALVWATNESLTITLPDSAGALVVWGAVTDQASGDLVIDDKPTMDLTFTPTNLNAAGAETAPTFT